MTIIEHFLAATGGLVVGAAGREISTFMLERIFSRKKNGNGNGTAAVVVDTLRHDQVTGILNQHTQILQGLAASNDKIKDGVIELVTLAKVNGRRRK